MITYAGSNKAVLRRLLELELFTALQPRVALPASVRAGAKLRYTVALANETDQDILLDPARGYIEDAFNVDLTASEQHRLNCVSVQSVAAHATVRFAMELVIPKTARLGTTTLYWNLLLPRVTATLRAGGAFDVISPASP